MKNRKAEIAKMILCGLAAAGIITVALVAPGFFVAFKPFYQGKKKYSDHQIKRSLSGLEKNRLVSIRQEGDKTIIKLTKNGQWKSLKYKLDDLKVKPQKRWDKKWRLVIFDVPIDRNQNRNAFVSKLRDIGFVVLQKSVWVCPYPCEDEIDFLKEIYEIRPFVRLVTAESIDIQQDLIKKFNLA